MGERRVRKIFCLISPATEKRGIVHHYFDGQPFGQHGTIPSNEATMSPQPSSPTEMSYTQLVKRAPMAAPTPAANKAQPTTLQRMVPRTAPPSTINVSPSFPPSVLFSDQLPMSSKPTQRSSDNHQALLAGGGGGSSATTVEDRLSSLAMKLQSTDTNSDCQSHASRSKSDIHQFITILRNMQLVVSRTVDEQQQQKKARALNTLLSMFESIIDERKNMQTSSNEPSTQHLEWRIKCLEGENQRLQSLCKDNNSNLQCRNQEMTLLQQEIQRRAAENERLRSDLASTQDQCQQEYLRAQEAEQVAAESETVRNNLLSSYGRLTQENVDLHREKEDNDAEKASLSKDLASMNEELDALRKQSSHNLKQLHVSYKEKKELERLLDCANVQLETQKNAIQAANGERQRIQDELHSSRRSAAAASEQLIKIRDEFTKKLQDDRNSKAKDSLVAKKLEEEQKRRAELEELVSRAKGKEDSAEEVSRKLARSNAELRSQVNQLIARMNYSTETFESDVIVEDCIAKDAPDETAGDNLSCYF